MTPVAHPARSPAGNHRIHSKNFSVLWPRPPLRLFAPSGGAERFTRLFRETWLSIGLGDRRRMLAYWTSQRKHCGPLWPRVELLEFWDGTRVRGLGGLKAGVYLRGFELRFRTKMVDAYPDDLVRNLIAHELAHVWQYATDNFAPEGPYAAVDYEEIADEVTHFWGFAPMPWMIGTKSTGWSR